MSRSALLLALLLATGGGLTAPTALATPDQTVLVTRGFDGRPGSSGGPLGHSIAPIISADGARIAFTSGAENLWPGPLDGQQQAVVRDLSAASFVLASRADGAAGAPTDNGGASAGLDASASGMTPDGRSVDFVGQLPTEPGWYGWRRDLAAGTTTLLTVDEDGHPVRPNGPVGTVGGGRYVAYSTDASVLAAIGPVAGALYLRDLATGTIALVSRATGRDGAPAGVIPVGGSPGGRYFTFLSGDGTLASGPPASDPDGGAFLYLRDVRLGQTILAGRADGRAGRAIGLKAYAGAPVVGDGCRVVFDATGTDVAVGSPPNGGSQVYVRDVCHGTTTLVSRTPDGIPAATPPPPPYAPTSDTMVEGVSADGRYVLFATAALNLADDLRLGQAELYLRDREGNRTILVSRGDGPDGPPVDDGSRYAFGTLTPDARFVAFSSASRTLTPDNTLGFSQIYRRELASVPPSEHPVPTCGAIDDPGLGGPPAPACPSDDDNNGDDDPPAVPAEPRPVTVAVPGATPATPSTAPVDAATVPTLVRAPTLSAITATAKAVRAWVDLPATVQVTVARQAGRRWRTQRTLKVVAQRAGRISVRLPKLARARYRLTIRALGPSGTASPAIVRTVDLRPRKAKSQ